MITYVQGDLLKSDVDLLVHQVNTLGIMGGGIAFQIKKVYPKTYNYYRQYCEHFKFNRDELMGNVYFSSETNNYYPNREVLICNVFGQKDIGRNSIQTDYRALSDGLETIKNYASNSGYPTIGMPYMIGCGLGGGDWNIVQRIIKETFNDYNGEIKIYVLNNCESDFVKELKLL